MEESIIIALGIIALLLAYIATNNKIQLSTPANKQAVDLKELEEVIDKYLLELLGENEKQYQAYLKDINFLQKKIAALEAKIQTLEQQALTRPTLDLQENRNAVYEDQGHLAKQAEPEQAALQTEIIIESVQKDPTASATTDRVIELYQQGLSVEEIARQLQLMCGEVQLMISLHTRKNKIKNNM